MRKISNEIKQAIKDKYEDKITKIKTRLKRYGSWHIEVDTNILNDYWVYNFKTKEYEQIGKKTYKEIEDWIKDKYKDYRIAWECSINEEIVKIKNEIEKTVFNKYKHLIGTYYDDYNNKRHLLIVKVNPS